MRNTTDQINELLTLKKGWLDGDGESVNKTIADIFLRELKDINVPIFPTPEGGLQAEFDVISLEVRINPGDIQAEFSYFEDGVDSELIYTYVDFNQIKREVELILQWEKK